MENRSSVWVEAIMTVIFDLEEGQLVDKIIPFDFLTKKEARAISYNSFPDSFTFNNEGALQYTFQLRRATESQDEQQTSQVSDRYQNPSLKFKRVSHTIYQCFTYFLQKKDPTNPRGYFQKSLVFITTIKNQYKFFNQLVSQVATEYFRTLDDSFLEKVMSQTLEWPEPFSEITQELTLFDKTYTILNPAKNKKIAYHSKCLDMIQLKPNDEEADKMRTQNLKKHGVDAFQRKTGEIPLGPKLHQTNSKRLSEEIQTDSVKLDTDNKDQAGESDELQPTDKEPGNQQQDCNMEYQVVVSDSQERPNEKLDLADDFQEDFKQAQEYKVIEQIQETSDQNQLEEIETSQAKNETKIPTETYSVEAELKEEIDGFLIVPDNLDSLDSTQQSSPERTDQLQIQGKSVKSNSSSVLSQDFTLNLEQAHSFNAQNEGDYSDINIFTLLKGNRALLWHKLWEIMMLNENLLIVADSPKICSEVVFGLVSIMKPFKTTADYYPYLTVFDKDMEYIKSQLDHSKDGVILGVTNPFFLKVNGVNFQAQQSRASEICPIFSGLMMTLRSRRSRTILSEKQSRPTPCENLHCNLKLKTGCDLSFLGQYQSSSLKSSQKKRMIIQDSLLKQFLPNTGEESTIINNSILRKNLSKLSFCVVDVIQDFFSRQRNDLKIYKKAEFLQYVKNKDYAEYMKPFGGKSDFCKFIEDFVETNNYKTFLKRNFNIMSIKGQSLDQRRLLKQAQTT